MRLHPLINTPTLQAFLTATIIGLTAITVYAGGLQLIAVNIFGDGDPANGIEDSRQQILGGRRNGESLADQRMNAGTIVCDGKIRGTAMVVDTREYAPGLEGVVLASAAHVIYDLDKGKPFKRCKFQLMAFGELRRYQAKIDLKYIKMGGYDPLEATNGSGFGEGDWVFLYVPRPWQGFDPDESLQATEFAFADLQSFRQAGGEFRLIAFNADTSVMSVSRYCNVIESKNGDLGGGAWPGQLLDDCDSANGSSGGGIVAVLSGKHYLVGIRNGSHWSEQVFPSKEYPLGPPDGANWDRLSNTNFARAFDADLLGALKSFTIGLNSDNYLL